jgi:L-fuconolactonase
MTRLAALSDDGLVDAHVHFWDWSRRDDILIVSRRPELRRDFLWRDLAPELAAANVDQAVAIQSAPNDDETDHLLGVCAEASAITGVVGWIDLAAPDVGDRIDRLARRPKLVGVRVLTHRLDDPGWIAAETVAPGLTALAVKGLSLDLTATANHLPAIARVARTHPDLTIIVDHGATAPLATGDQALWRQAIADVARFPNVATKLSGLAEEAGPAWSVDTLLPFARHLFDCFGVGRLMWASNWPCIDLVGGYGRWALASADLVERLTASTADRRALLAGTARRLYRLRA